jgi:mycothiol synthase
VTGDVEVRTSQAIDLPGIRRVMEASLAHDGIPGFLAHDIERAMVRIEPDPLGTVVALEDGVVVGYCTPNHDDLTVLPDARRRGHGRRLVTAARAVVHGRDEPELQLYVPAHLPASMAFADAVGLRYRSSLWQFELSADAADRVPEPAFPANVVVRTWDDDRDTDFEAWAAFMLAAFEGHPSPMHWTPAVIRHVHDAPGFDPTGILLVTEAGDPERLVAFTRVELVPDDDAAAPGRHVGDVGLIGVLPSWRRRGLGRELLRWGVTTLRARGAARIELSVEAANERATALYRAHGFEPAIEWPHWVVEAA